MVHAAFLSVRHLYPTTLRTLLFPKKTDCLLICTPWIPENQRLLFTSAGTHAVWKVDFSSTVISRNE